MSSLNRRDFLRFLYGDTGRVTVSVKVNKKSDSSFTPRFSPSLVCDDYRLQNGYPVYRRTKISSSGVVDSRL